jgi:hypothetical protein
MDGIEGIEELEGIEGAFLMNNLYIKKINAQKQKRIIVYLRHCL